MTDIAKKKTMNSKAFTMTTSLILRAAGSHKGVDAMILQKGLQALRGVSGMRAFFKVNESKILAEIHTGNKPKGFTVE